MARIPHQKRVRARRCAVQALYQWLIADQPPKEIIDEFVSDRELINVDRQYFSTLTTEVPEHYSTLVDAISPHLDRDWHQLDPVERCVLLIGTYELGFRPEIPWKVIVNEAIDLCKMFGSEEAHRYVNGVLDKVAHDRRHDEIVGLAAT